MLIALLITGSITMVIVGFTVLSAAQDLTDDY